MRIHKILLLPFVFALIQPTSVFADGNRPRIVKCSTFLEGGIEFPAKINPGSDFNKHFTYGLEVEYSLQEASDALFEYYGPASTVMPKEEWFKLGLKERREWMKTHIKELFPDGPKADGKIELVVQNPDLPKQLILDETGNVELITAKPFDSTTLFYEYIDRVQKLLGDGYVQASLGVPSEVFYKRDTDAQNFLGLRSFIVEFDTLDKLEEAFAKHSAEPKYIPAKNFTHPFLGPMNSNKVNFLRNVFSETRDGDVTKDILDRISKTDASYKYTSQVAYRPDILRSDDRFILEVRQCVKNFDCLKRLLNREKYFINNDLSGFGKFSDMTHLDLIADFNLLSKDSQEMLKNTFTNILPRDTADEMLVTEVYRNFAYPLQDWKKWLKKMKYGASHPIHRIVAEAEAEYVAELKSVAQDFKSQTIDQKVAENRVRIALARFVHDSTLKTQFEVYLRSELPGTKDI